MIMKALILSLIIYIAKNHILVVSASHCQAKDSSCPKPTPTAPSVSKMAGKHERTFLAVKPDGVQRGLVGDVLKRFEQRGYKIVALKMIHVSFLRVSNFCYCLISSGSSKYIPRLGMYLLIPSL